MSRALLLAPLLIAAGCATRAPEPDPDLPALRETTLTRHDGTAVSLEELQSIRASAMATADSIARIERELLEPWAETRTPAILIENLTLRHPADTRLAANLWESAEPPGRGHGRERFREYGYFSNQLMPTLFGARTRPANLEALVVELLKTHDDSTPVGLLLAAWRRFSPMVSSRQAGYLAAGWQFELDYFPPVRVSLAESLMGPHLRSGVASGDYSFPGPMESHDGYSSPLMLIDLLMPGPDCPVSQTVGALARLAAGERVSLPFTLAPGRRQAADDSEREFLSAALAGLAQGICELEYLPAATRTFSVTFSYLVDRAEARSTLGFARTGSSWELSLFEYEPASAKLIGSSARLDLLPVLRDMVARNQRE